MEVLRVLINVFEAFFDGLLVLLVLQYLPTSTRTTSSAVGGFRQQESSYN